MKSIKHYIFFFISVCTLPSCKKYLDVNLSPSLMGAELVFSTDLTATSAVTAMYYNLMEQQGSFLTGYSTGISQAAGLTADELNYYSYDPVFTAFGANAINQDAYVISWQWNSTYQIIYQANAVLEGLAVSTGVTDATKKQLEGEAKFIRALSHFYLVNTFGSVPLITTTNYKQTASANRAAISEIYESVINDLLDAQNNLSATYPTQSRARPNRSTATALLARVYLYDRQWANAEEQASMLINDPLYFLVTDMSQVFKISSSEVIWQLKPTGPQYNTYQAANFILTFAPQNTLGGVALTSDLINSFEPGDKRKDNWIGSYTEDINTWYYPYKYKIESAAAPTDECSVIFRLAEQFLIRAEARIQQNRIEEGIEDINEVRERSRAEVTVDVPDPLPALSPSLNQSDALLAVENERRHELFTEYGHRWFDLKRTQRASAVLSLVKPEWTDDDTLYPLPLSEMQKNVNLRPQNKGY